jgi:hypothetical protein
MFKSLVQTSYLRLNLELCLNSSFLRTGLRPSSEVQWQTYLCSHSKVCRYVSRVTRWVCQKNRPKFSQTHSLSKLISNLCGKISSNSVIFKVNNRPIGENLPNLVTLCVRDTKRARHLQVGTTVEIFEWIQIFSDHSTPAGHSRPQRLSFSVTNKSILTLAWNEYFGRNLGINLNQSSMLRSLLSAISANFRRNNCRFFHLKSMLWFNCGTNQK